MAGQREALGLTDSTFPEVLPSIAIRFGGAKVKRQSLEKGGCYSRPIIEPRQDGSLLGSEHPLGRG